MYLLKVKDSSFTIPKTNIKLLAQIKAIDLHKDFNIITHKRKKEKIQSKIFSKNIQKCVLNKTHIIYTADLRINFQAK